MTLNYTKKKKGFLATLMDVDPIGDSLKQATDKLQGEKKSNIQSHGQVLTQVHAKSNAQSLPQSINQSVSQTVNQTMSQTANDTLSQSLNNTPDHSFNDTLNNTINNSSDNTLNNTVNNSFNNSLDDTINHTLNQSLSQSLNNTLNESSDNTLSQSQNNTLDNSLNHTSSESQKPVHDVSDPIYWITDKQSTVLAFLISKKEKITQVKEIIAHTGIPDRTIRGALSILTKYHFITKPKKIVRGSFQGLSYSINKTLCDRFMQNRFLYSKSHAQSHAQVHAFSSSINIYNKTTTKADVENLLKNNPELGYWRLKSLTSNQILNWMKIAECDLQKIFLYLCYCRFDMVDLGIEESKPVNNVFNWFFKMLEKTGGYPMPKGYKSLEEKRAEEAEILAKQSQEAANRAKEAFKRKQQAEEDREFWEMMNNSEGEIYRWCYNNLSDIFKRRRSGEAFEAAMRGEFQKWKEKVN